MLFTATSSSSSSSRMTPRSAGTQRRRTGRSSTSSSILFFLLTTLCLLPLLLQPHLSTANALREDEAGHVDWYLPRIGVPRTDANTANPGKIGTRFHKLLRPGMTRKEKGQTAIYTVTESNVISALNPKNGGIVWRQIFDEDDPILAFWTIYENVLVISGPGGSTVRLFHALSGHLIWETVQHYPRDAVLTATEEEAGQLTDADFITYGLQPSAYTIANADTVRRLSWYTGEKVWKWQKPAEDPTVSLARVLLSGDQVHVFGLRKATSIRSLLGGSSADGSTIIHYILSTADGSLLSRAEISTPVGSGGPADLQFATTTTSAKAVIPHLVWLGRDGAIRSLSIAYKNTTGDEQAAKAPNPVVLYARSSSVKFTQLLDVGLRDKALLVAKREDHHGEVIRLMGEAQPKLSSEWEFEEEALDAVYSGAYDRDGKGYVNRVFFQRAQHLLNFHVFWAEAEFHGERGQVTGYSFQWDHDLSGNVLAAPFEGSPVSPYQMLCRSVFVTSSGSLRMVQEDKHQWMREESLTQIQVATFVDLPEQKLSTLSPSQAQAAAQGTEGFVRRLQRHLLSLRDLPAWLVEFGERFVSGTYEESWNYPPQEEEKAPTSTMATAGPKKGQMEEVPGPAHLAPRTLLPNETAAILRRDPFGFRKVIVAGTSKGKLFLIDGAMRGKVLWEKSLVGYGPGEGHSVPTVTFRSIMQVRSIGETTAADSADENSQAQQGGEDASSSSRVPTVKGPLLSIVADVENEGVTVTRVFYIEALSGTFVDGQEAGTPVAMGPAKDVFGLPIVDAQTGRRALSVIGSQNQAVVIPDNKAVLDDFNSLLGKFFFSLRFTTPGGIDGLEGFTIGAAGKSIKIWKVEFAEGERIVDVISASEDPVASQGKVLGNRKTLYKYLNPHTRVVTTLSSVDGTAGIYLIDGVTGKVLFETKAKGVDVSEGVHAVFVENWIVASYVVSSSADPHSQRVLSVEIYDGAANERGIFEWTDVFSSFGRTSQRASSKIEAASATAAGTAGVGEEGVEAAGLQIFQQTFVAPWGIRTLGTTRTKHGISTKSLLIANDLNQIVSINRRLLDPRRPVGRKPNAEEAEEMLFSYDPLLPWEPKWTLSHIFPLGKISGILATPASIESTSMVFAHGLDSYVSRVSPSGSFDILSANFNKVQLMLTIAALAVGIIVTKPLLRSKAVNARW
ncbi:hypothetical protein A4X09_0g5061 [Tilletia walkeri]|uniref:ER membrane protein complex subunit 1 n=1 Tax=Tilletia walkeri TaxID=117179 RepID=A0A8X7N7Z1_9BASI|nr:hypothetical protein A4X09_0g5061 [Tilletia walkeri]